MCLEVQGSFHWIYLDLRAEGNDSSCMTDTYNPIRTIPGNLGSLYLDCKYRHNWL